MFNINDRETRFRPEVKSVGPKGFLGTHAQLLE